MSQPVNEYDIKLGDWCKDEITEIVGTVIGESKYLNEREYWLLQPKCQLNGAPIDAIWFDKFRVKLTKDDHSRQSNP